MQSATTTTPDLLLTPSTNVSTTPAPSAPARTITMEALTHALNLAGTTLQPRNRVPVTALVTGVQPRPMVGQPVRSHQESGDNDGRGRKRIIAARGDVAAEKYYKYMLEMQ